MGSGLPSCRPDGGFETSPVADTDAGLLTRSGANPKRFDATVARRLSTAASNDILDDRRDAIRLRVLEDLSNGDIGVAVDVAVDTVRSRINRGRAGLRELLANLWASTEANNG